MKITNKTLASFNRGNEPCFNESYNKAQGWPNMLEYSFLCFVRNAVHGMFKGKITMAHIEDVLSYKEWKPSEALVKHAKREGITL